MSMINIFLIPLNNLLKRLILYHIYYHKMELLVLHDLFNNNKNMMHYLLIIYPYIYIYIYTSNFLFPITLKSLTNKLSSTSIQLSL